jgi:hypothetical protein
LQRVDASGNIDVLCKKLNIREMGKRNVDVPPMTVVATTLKVTATVPLGAVPPVPLPLVWQVVGTTSPAAPHPGDVIPARASNIVIAAA